MSNIDDILLGISESLKQLQKLLKRNQLNKPTSSNSKLGSQFYQKFTDDYYSKIADDYIEFTYKTQPSITLLIFQK